MINSFNRLMKLKNIAVIFIKGVFGDAGDKQLEIGNLAQAKKYISNFPELNVLARIESFYFEPEKDQTAAQSWHSLSKEIYSIWSKFDGFVVFYPLETILFAAPAVSFQLQPLSKPVVFTGSPFSLGGAKQTKQFDEWANFISRANLMNSVQTAVLNIAETVIVFGNRLIRASRARRAKSDSLNFFETDHQGLVGQIDFSVHLNALAKQRGNSRPKKPMPLEEQIAVIDLYPGFDQAILPIIVKNKKAVLVNVHDITHLPDLLKNISSVSQNIIVLYAQDSKSLPIDHKNAAYAKTFNFETALVKLMWVLGRKNPTIEKVRKIFDSDIAGEKMQ